MKRNLRFYLALWFAKGTALVLKLIGRKGTSMPGSWAIILCPDFLGRMIKPEKIIGITGTNGKTTIANMIEEILENRGEDFVCNREGSNVPTGIVSALIANSTFLGKPKKKLAVFEMDERSSVRFYPYMQPDLLIVTNIFRDSYRRNAHTEFIWNLLDTYIPEKTTLILNGDDPQCASLKENNKRLYFGIDRLDFETHEAHNLVRDGANCPVCDTPLSYDFTRYHHVGKAHCESCGYHTPEADYRILSADRDNKAISIKVSGKDYSIKAVDTTPMNLYNQIAAIAVLHEFGMSMEEISSAFAGMKVAESRLESVSYGGKTIVRHLAKGQNPVACSRAFDNTRNMPGEKCVMMFLDDHFDAMHSVENIAWFYDTDFEFLNDPHIRQIVVGGARHWDTYVRLLMAGVPKEKIVHMEDNLEVPKAVDFENCDTFVIYYDVYTIGLSNDIKDMLKKRAEEEEK